MTRKGPPGGSVRRKYIPVEESFRRWDKEPEFRRVYDALADEFALAAALIDARGLAMTAKRC
jgi:hypothetical protein